jgi:hypothetical protein
MMLVNQMVSVTLPAGEWLQIAGWMMGQPDRAGVANHLIDAIARTVLKDER